MWGSGWNQPQWLIPVLIRLKSCSYRPRYTCAPVPADLPAYVGWDSGVQLHLSGAGLRASNAACGDVTTILGNTKRAIIRRQGDTIRLFPDVDDPKRVCVLTLPASVIDLAVGGSNMMFPDLPPKPPSFSATFDLGGSDGGKGGGGSDRGRVEREEIFQYITRYTPHETELDSTLKCFVPDYIPWYVYGWVCNSNFWLRSM